MQLGSPVAPPLAAPSRLASEPTGERVSDADVCGVKLAPTVKVKHWAEVILLTHNATSYFLSAVVSG